MSFCCPNCSENLSFYSLSPETTKDGYLKCPECIIHIPIVNCITYFTESDISFGEDGSELTQALKTEIERKRADYINFIDKKITKKLVDPYSAFQPFNESSRAFYPFIKLLKEEILKPNDVILDTWCRTGWSTFFLAGLFPDQEIISIWEGNKDVLGYQGFDYWLSPDKKPSNVRVVFADLNKRLPFKTDSIKFVYGLDTLHRYSQSTLIPELFRVISADGVVIFPHIHLTNSVPDPFFERGEKQLHGMDYDRYFRSFLKDKDLKAYINSEPRMFGLDSPETLINDPNTTDYNAIIAVIPKNLSDPVLHPFLLKPNEIVYQSMLVNPYLDINLNDGIVKLDRDYLNGVVGEMLDRHPIYQKKISRAHNYVLSNEQVKILYLANHNYSNKEIIEWLEIEEERFVKEVLELALIEIVHILPFSRNAINLQFFHAARKSSTIENHTLRHLSSIADGHYQNEVIINSIDDSELSRDDTTYLINRIQGRFAAVGLNAGERIVISSKPHFEALLVFWAAVEVGLEVCIFNTELSANVKAALIDDLNPGLIFVDSSVYHELNVESIGNLIVYDETNFSGIDDVLFSHWIEGDVEKETTSVKVLPHSNAVILFTSGTTGKPKGIQLSQSALFRSGQLLSEIYEWNSEDRLLMVTELDSMSGLRNVCVATLFTGTTVVVPDVGSENQIFSIIEDIKKHNVTLLSATPALINQLIQLGGKIRNDLKSLRQVICTGGKLTEKLAAEFESCFGLRIYNYYGLTETTGLCIGEYPSATNKEYGFIGVAVDSIVQIVDEKDQILGPDTVGRLRVFNNRLMTGYLDAQDESNLQISNGWLYTGDLAIRDQSGFFYLKAREREIVKDPMGNVTYLSEVEDCLLAHAEVKDAVVCPVEYHEIEQLAAFIIHKSPCNSDDLANSLKVHVINQLGKWKCPIFIEFMDQFPVTSRGQIDKKALTRSIKVT